MTLNTIICTKLRPTTSLCHICEALDGLVKLLVNCFEFFFGDFVFGVE